MTPMVLHTDEQRLVEAIRNVRPCERQEVISFAMNLAKMTAMTVEQPRPGGTRLFLVEELRAA